MSNSKINKKLLMILSSLGFASATTTLLTMSCSCREDDLNKIAQNVKIHEIPNKSEIKASELTKDQIKFFNYDTLKYTCEVIRLESNNSQGTVDVYYQLKNKKTNNVSKLQKTTLNSFKLAQSPNPGGGEDQPNPPIIPSDPRQLEVQKSKNIIKKDERVRYLALGDSITAGFTGVLDKDYQGTLNPDGSLSGMSYPVYLAHFLNKDKENRVEKFNNFATSNSTILEWLDLLDTEYISANPDIFKNEESVYQHTFDGRYTDKTEFKKQLVKEIKESNLITLTLGANDFFRFFGELLRSTNISKIIEQVIAATQQGKPLDYGTLLSFYLEFIGKAKTEITARLKTLIQKISELNPKTNIAVFNYPAPFLRLLVSLYDFLPDDIKSMIKGKDIISFLISPLSEAIYSAVKAAAKPNVSFVNVFDSEFWAENQDKLTSIFLDLHPTTSGYKKLATDAFIKLTNSSISKANLKRFGWTESYLNDNANTHQQFIELNNEDYTSFYKSTFGTNKEDSLKKLYEEDAVYDSVKSHISLTHISRRFRSFTDAQITEIVISILTKSQRWSYLQELDPEANIPSFFKENGKAATFALVKWIKKSKYINDQLDNFQKLLIETDWDKDGIPGIKVLKKQHILELFSKTFFDKQNLLFLLKEFLASDFTKDFKDGFAKAIEGFIKNAFKSNKLDAVIEFIAAKFEDKYKNFIDKSDLVILLKEIFHSDNLPSFFGTSLKSILTAGNTELSSEETFNKITSFEGLIKLLFSNQDENSEIGKSFTKLFQEIIKKPNVNPVFVRVLNKFIKSNPQFAPLFEGIEADGIKNIIGAFTNVFIKFEDKFNVSTLLAKALMAEIAQNGLSFKFDKFKDVFIGEISQTFGSFEKALEILKLLADEQQLKDHKDVLKKLIENIIKFAEKSFKLKETIEKQEFFNKFLTKEQISTIYTKLVSSQNISKIADYFVNVLSVKDLDLTNVTTAKQLLQKILETPSVNPLDLLKDLIKSNLIDNTSITDVLAKILKQKFGSLPFMGYVSEQKISVLMRNFLTLCVNLDDKQHFLKRIILTVADILLDKTPSSESVYKRLYETLKTELFGTKEKVKSIIKDLLSEPIMQGGKTWIIKYLKGLNNAEITALLNDGSIEKLLKKLYDSEDIIDLSAETIFTIFSSLTFEDISSLDKTRIIKKIIGEGSTFYNSIPDKVVELIKKLIKETDNQKIIAAFVKSYLETKFPKLKGKITSENFEKFIKKIIEFVVETEDKHSALKNGIKWALRYFETNISSFDASKFIKDFAAKTTTKLLSMLKGNEDEFINKIFETLKEVLNLQDTTQQNFLTKFIWDLIPAGIKSNVSKFIDEDKFTHLFNQFIESNKAKELLTSLLKAMIKNVEGKMTSIKSFDDFIKVVFSDPEAYNETIKLVSDNLAEILNKSSIKGILKSVLKNLLPSGVNDDSTVGDIVNNFIPNSLKKLEQEFKLFEDISKAIISSISTNGFDLEKIKLVVFDKLISKIKNNEQEFVNKFFNVIKEVFGVTVSQQSTFLDEFIWKLVPSEIKSKLGSDFTQEKLRYFINEFVLSDKIKEIFAKTLKAIVQNVDGKFATIKTFDEFIKQAFSNTDAFDEAITLISNNIEAIIKKPSVMGLLKSTIKGFTSLWIKIDDADIDKLISNLLPELAKKANTEFKLVEDILKVAITSLGTNGFNITKLQETVFAKFKEKLDSLMDLKTLVKFINNNVALFKQPENLNIIKSILKANADSLVKKLPQSVSNYISESELINVLKSIFDNEKIYETIFDIIDKIDKDTTTYNGLLITNPLEILYKFVDKEKQYIKDKIKLIGKDFVSNSANQDVLVRLIKANFKEYTKIELSNEHDAFFKKLIQNMFDILNDIKVKNTPILDYMLDIILTNIREPQKISQKLLDPTFIQELYSVPFLVSILNQQQIKTSSDQVVKLFDEIFREFQKDDEKIETFLNKFKIVELINKDPATQSITKDFIKNTIKNEKLFPFIKAILLSIFTNSDKLQTAKRWIEVIRVVFENDTNELKSTFVEFVKAMLNDPNASLAKQIDVVLTKSWKDNPSLYRRNVIDNNQHTIEKFVDTFFTASIKENNLFTIIINNVFDKLKTVNVKAKDQMKEIKNKIILGAIKFVTKTGNEKAIHLPTLVGNYKDNIVTLFEHIDSAAFTNMINYVFDATIFNLDAGVYSFLFGGRFKTEATSHLQEIKNNVKSDRALFPLAFKSATINRLGKRRKRDTEDYQEIEDVKIEFQIGTGFELLSLISADKLIGSIFLPSISQFLNSVSTKKYSSKDELNKIIKKLPGYRATSRVYTALSVMLCSNMTADEFWMPKPNWWEFTKLAQYALGAYPENYISKGVEFAYKKILEKGDLKSKIKNLYNSSSDHKLIGLTSSINYDNHYFAGYADGKDSRTEEFRKWTNWSEDSITAYIVNYNKTENKHHNKHNIVLIAKMLQYGYLYKDMDKDNK
ncbi:SGNH/GDSL hydrolase family protein [Metamycoplasma hyosynoviae]|uniref:SGNH/GDSL hydrolase family protein n=1 Tax=Metamycoplasma hyosynoviae TaxID=29559 RepID=UPI0023657029|nr:SGNH/GDSL hydrolase family protein [Metamycoplasma hyosynoviae]MDD7912305.1 GDSL-type esterase/lipase family protein [Metamycoplasma hyosynoviae]